MPSPTRRLSLVLAWLCMTGAAAAFAPLNYYAYIPQGLLLIGVGAICLRLAAPREGTEPIRVPAVQGKARLTPVVLGAGLLALLTAISVYDWPVHYVLQSALLYGGAVLIVIGLSGWRGRIDGRTLWQSMTQQGTELLPLGLIVLLAFALRVWGLGDFVHVHVDELYPASQIARLREMPTTPILQPMDAVAPFTWVYVTWQRASVGLFGANFIGLRLPAAIVGALTVAALYGLARTWFDRRTALLAALLLATLPPHIHLTRLGMINPPDALAGTLALWFLGRAWKHNWPVDWSLAGVCLGATAYFHEGGRLLFPLLTVVWLLLHLFGWRRRGHGLMSMTVSALLIALPVYLTLWARSGTLAPRLDDMGVTGEFWTRLLLSRPDDGLWSLYFRQMLGPALLHYIHLPDSSGLYYGGDTALVLPWMLPAFFIGLAWLAWRLDTPAAPLLIIWMIGTAVGNSLLGVVGESRYTVRFLVAFPALSLVTALGLRYGIGVYVGRWLGRAILPIGAALALSQVVYYFGIHLPQFNLQLRRELDYEDVMYRALDLPTGTQSYLITRYTLPEPPFAVLSRFWEVDLPLEITPAQAVDRIWFETLPSAPLAFFVAPDDIETYTILGQYFEALHGPYFSPYALPLEKQYALWRVESGRTGEFVRAPTLGWRVSFDNTRRVT